MYSREIAENIIVELTSQCGVAFPGLKLLIICFIDAYGVAVSLTLEEYQDIFCIPFCSVSK
jgi:hypothetical protein